MKAKTGAHGHAWLFGMLGLATGIALLVGFPRLEAGGGVVGVALFDLAGIALVLAPLDLARQRLLLLPDVEGGLAGARARPGLRHPGRGGVQWHGARRSGQDCQADCPRAPASPSGRSVGPNGVGGTGLAAGPLG